MGDLVLGIFLIAGTYLGSAGFAILLFRIFFPLKTKPVGENKFTLAYSRNKTERPSTKNKVHLLSINGRRGWVKVNS